MGERKAQENLKHDLVRRIKMLEYALKQERLIFFEYNLLILNIYFNRARFQQFMENSDGQQNGGASNNENDGDERNSAGFKNAKLFLRFL